MKTDNGQKIGTPEIPHKLSFWQKVGGGSLAVSVTFHGILLAIGLVWALKIIPPSDEKPVNFIPRSGGGGPPSAARQAEKHRVQMTQSDLPRVAALGLISNVTLPEPDALTQMTSMGVLTNGGLSEGLGGSGGGSGTSIGRGFGDGAGIGLSNGTGSKNPFGMLNAEQGALAGTFYDLKQTKDRKPTDMTAEKMRLELMELTRRGFKESAFANYFKAPNPLYQTKLFIPRIPADGAPAAFEVEKEVQPKMWVVVYRGAVQAPKSGKFRFVGACDDFMVVRFNNRPVFDYGYTMAGAGLSVNGRAADFNGTNRASELARNVRRLTPMKLPITFYQYASTPELNRNIGGLAVGPTFEVEAGQTYPIDIMIGEIPGGYFSMALMIEEVGASYHKATLGSPILPLFRLDAIPPTDDITGEAPPFATDGPVWKFVPAVNKRDI